MKKSSKIGKEKNFFLSVCGVKDTFFLCLVPSLTAQCRTALPTHRKIIGSELPKKFGIRAAYSTIFLLKLKFIYNTNILCKMVPVLNFLFG
jgi:hypothetical protein